MDRERLLAHLNQSYTAKGDLLAQIPLGVKPEDLWQEVLSRRVSQATPLPLLTVDGKAYWFVTTDRMIAASEKIIDELMECGSFSGPYGLSNQHGPTNSYGSFRPLASLEEVFFTSFVEGMSISMKDAMIFLQSGREPRDIQEQILSNNYNAMSFAAQNLYIPIDATFLQNLVYLLTENMDGGGPAFRSTDTIHIPSMIGESYRLPLAAHLPARVQEITRFLADPAAHPLIKAGIAQAWCLITRPFPEGNERLSRILSQIILLRAGYSFFSEVSLSKAISQSSFQYYSSIANILRPENGNDLTYFLDYYLSILAEAIDDRRRKKESINIEAEQVMATESLKAGNSGVMNSRPAMSAESMSTLTPEEFDAFSPVNINTAEIEDETQISVDNDESAAFTEVSPRFQALEDETVDSSPVEHDDLPSDPAATGHQTSPPNLIPIQLVLALNSFSVSDDSTSGQCARTLLGFLEEGRTKFNVNDIALASGLPKEPISKLLWKLKEGGYLTIAAKDGIRNIYQFANFKCPSYTAAIYKTVDRLVNSSSSGKDRRLGEMLMKGMQKGRITKNEYLSARLEGRWYGDMVLAQQMGLVEKLSSDTYRILQDVRSEPPTLNQAQKEAATTLYETFGGETFSTEMLIATLDYQPAQASAILHQFTLLRILDCRRDTVNKYQFLVNPEEHPEYFLEAA